MGIAFQDRFTESELSPKTLKSRGSVSGTEKKSEWNMFKKNELGMAHLHLTFTLCAPSMHHEMPSSSYFMVLPQKSNPDLHQVMSKS